MEDPNVEYRTRNKGLVNRNGSKCSKPLGVIALKCYLERVLATTVIIMQLLLDIDRWFQGSDQS